ncbi:MAG: SDR family oxidoreductase [Spirochaetales bacterium]|nr:SDR family oxidoreductase [Spirochaetales bacterium]
MSYVEQMFGLSDKIVILTGGGGIIARAMSEALLKAGATVVLWDISQLNIDEAISELKEKTGQDAPVSGMIVDTTSEPSVEQAIDAVEKSIGIPNALINAAGGNRGKAPFVETDVEQFEFVLRLNLVAGLMVPTKVFAKYWISGKIRASIINMTSMASYIPLSGVWAYDAAKAAVLNLTMATAKEFAADGIRVNAIAPGFFVGKQNKALLIKNEETGELTERGKAVIGHTPLQRFGDVSELTGATIFLLSDTASGFVTGISLAVDGGYLVYNV